MSISDGDTTSFGGNELPIKAMALNEQLVEVNIAKNRVTPFQLDFSKIQILVDPPLQLRNAEGILGQELERKEEFSVGQETILGFYTIALLLVRIIARTAH